MSSLTRSACPAWPPVLSFTRRTAVYGPVRTVVWEGRAGNRSPYPDRRGENPHRWKSRRACPEPSAGAGPRALRYQAGTNLLLLDPDVRKAFRSDGAVNDALR